MRFSTPKALTLVTAGHRQLRPIVADAEAGFGGVLNAFELMKANSGAAGVHWEDQLPSLRNAATWGKVLVPTVEACR
jgi:isocitrate lyase